MDDPGHKEELSVPDGLLSTLERDFKEAVQAVENEESMGHYLLEYEKLYRALKKSHESEKQLVARCQDLTQELLANAAKMQAAVKLSQGDHSTIEALKKEIEKAWRTVDSANDKDLRARETVKTLKEEVATLQTMIEEGSALSTDHTTTLEELKLENKRLQVETEELAKQVETQTKEMSQMTAAIARAEADRERDTAEGERVAGRFELVRQEFQRERNARERADYQSRDLLLQLKAREETVRGGEMKLSDLESAVAKLQSQVRADREKQQAVQQKVETAERQLFHTQQSYNDTLDTTADLNDRLQEVDRQIQECTRQSEEARAEAERVQRIKDSDYKEFGRLQQLNDNLRQDHQNLERQKALLKKRIESVRAEKGSLQEALDLVQRESRVLAKRGEEERARREAIELLIRGEMEGQGELEDSIAREREIAARLTNALMVLEKDRDKCVVEVSQINQQHRSAYEELKLATVSVEEAQRLIDEKESKLTTQQAQYEHVRAERNQLSKKLIETQDEIMELKQKFKMMDHQLFQLQDELQMKNKQHHDEVARQKAEKERLTKARKLVSDQTAAFEAAKAQSSTVGQQIQQLVRVVDECDKELSVQQQRFLKISNERDLLGAQLIRRNDELLLLYEKLRLQQDALNNGEAAYRARVDDLRLLRLKIAEVGRQTVLASTRAHAITETKERIRHLEREVAEVQAKVAALSEELENPKNTSRWRRIGGHDPAPEDLSEKITDLQKRLIAKSEDSLEHELVLQEKERLVTELQGILARQPGMEVAQQLSVRQKELQKKNSRMKQKASELNMASTHISELKYEAERLRRELHATKRRYYEIMVMNDELLQSATNRTTTAADDGTADVALAAMAKAASLAL